MFYFDLHCDTASECFKNGESFCENNFAVSKKRLCRFNKWWQFCAVFVSEETKQPCEYYQKIVDNLKAQTKIITEKPQFEKGGVLLSLEGGTPIESVDFVDKMYGDGVRLAALTWNGKNKIAGGVNSDGEFTQFGKAVVGRMNELGMVVDLSHLNDISFDAVINDGKYCIASHTASRYVNNHKRNLTDRQICAIIEKKGLIGLTVYPVFLGDGNVYDNFYKHLYRICELGGEDAVALGTDFDGAEMSEALNNVSKMQTLCKYLSSKGFNTQKLFYKNAYAFFKRVL